MWKKTFTETNGNGIFKVLRIFFHVSRRDVDHKMHAVLWMKFSISLNRADFGHFFKQFFLRSCPSTNLQNFALDSSSLNILLVWCRKKKNNNNKLTGNSVISIVRSSVTRATLHKPTMRKSVSKVNSKSWELIRLPLRSNSHAIAVFDHLSSKMAPPRNHRLQRFALQCTDNVILSNWINVSMRLSNFYRIFETKALALSNFKCKNYQNIAWMIRWNVGRPTSANSICAIEQNHRQNLKQDIFARLLISLLFLSFLCSSIFSFFLLSFPFSFLSFPFFSFPFSCFLF